MRIRLSRWLWASMAALWLLPAQAQPSGTPASGGSCVAPEHAGHPMLGREERITQYEGLGVPCLKRLLVQCNAAASREMLDSGAAMACSIGYEALLKRGFNGDFQAMLAWWRNRPEDGSVQ